MKTIQFRHEQSNPENLNELNRFLSEHPVSELNLVHYNSSLCMTRSFNPETSEVTSTTYTHELRSIELSIQEPQENEESYIYQAVMFAISTEMPHEHVINLWRQMNPQYVVRISSVSLYEQQNMNAYLLLYHPKQK